MKTLWIRSLARLGAALSAACLLSSANQYSALADDSGTGVAPPNSHPFGKTYSQWAGRWQRWYLQYPVNGPVSHPGIDSPSFNVSSNQSGQVWFLAAPLGGPVTRNVTIPAGKALLFALLTAEASTLECQGCGGVPCNNSPFCFCKGTSFGNPPVPVQSYWANHAVNLTCMIDNVAVPNITSFRAPNPEITFTAPSPWINSCSEGGSGAEGGATGTSVGDGYFIFLNPLSPGAHTLHYTGNFHLDASEPGGPLDVALDMTYNITVQPPSEDEAE
jgi:hypothetical protein